MVQEVRELRGPNRQLYTLGVWSGLKGSGQVSGRNGVCADSRKNNMASGAAGAGEGASHQTGFRVGQAKRGLDWANVWGMNDGMVGWLGHRGGQLHANSELPGSLQGRVRGPKRTWHGKPSDALASCSGLRCAPL